VDLDRVLLDIADVARNPWEDSLRFWFNTRTSGEGRAVDPRLWKSLARPNGPPPAGSYIGLGFDGSISQDATVLRGCTPEGYSWDIKTWQRPSAAELELWKTQHEGRDWHVNRLDVDQVVEETFATYRVGRMLCDPPKWWTEIEGWAKKHGEDVVLALDTNAQRKFAPAVDRWMTALREGTHTHDGDELTSDHVKSAHKRRVHVNADVDDGRTLYVLVKGEDGQRIDAAVADVLAHEAAMTMPPAPAPARVITADDLDEWLNPNLETATDASPGGDRHDDDQESGPGGG